MNKDNKERYVFCVAPEDGQNFWDANKELEYLTPYAQFKKKEGKRRSGRIMHAIWLVYDPKARASNSGNRGEDELKADIAEHFLNEKNFNWGEYRTIIQAFIQDCKSKIEKELDYWEMELKTRRVYQRSLPWDTERDEKDKMLITQDKLFESYLKIRKELDQERSEKRYHSNTHKSLLEQES